MRKNQHEKAISQAYISCVQNKRKRKSSRNLHWNNQRNSIRFVNVTNVSKSFLSHWTQTCASNNEIYISKNGLLHLFESKKLESVDQGWHKNFTHRMVMEIGILCTIHTHPTPVLEYRIILEYRKTLYSWKWERKKYLD